jgi:hypothetical protein
VRSTNRKLPWPPKLRPPRPIEPPLGQIKPTVEEARGSLPLFFPADIPRPLVVHKRPWPPEYTGPTPQKAAQPM